MEQQELSDEFLREFTDLRERFDALADKDSFQGPQLELMTKEFLKKHQVYMDRFSYFVPTRYPNCSQADVLDEDLAVLSDKERSKKGFQVPEYANVLAEFWRRAAAAAYLRLTLNKARHDLEEDRREPVEMARKAIRYSPDNFKVCCWYTIALGYQLDGLRGPRERSIYGRIFLAATMHCIRLEPNDALSHSLLARYYYGVASLSWLERKVAKGLLGVQVEGSYEDAERELRLAHSLQPDWMPTGLWMARVLLALKRPLDEVRTWIDLGLKQEVLEPTTEIERRELLELRSKLRLSN